MSSDSKDLKERKALNRRRFPLLMRSAWFGLNQSFRAKMKPFGLTPDQFTVLRWLHEMGDECISQADLSRLMASDNNTITSIVSRMEKSGWIRREPHIKDQRAHRLLITEEGEELFVQAESKAIELQGNILSALTDAERQIFLEHLDKISEACLRERDKKGHS